MVEAGAFVLKALFDEATALFGDFARGEAIVFLFLQDADDVEVDVGAVAGEALGDDVGVLDGHRDDRRARILRQAEGAGVEGEQYRVGEVFVAGAFGGDADGAAVLSGVFGGEADDLRAVVHVALLDGQIARITHPGAGDGDAEVAGLGDEDEVAGEEGGDREFVKDGDVVVDQDEGLMVGDFA